MCALIWAGEPEKGGEKIKVVLTSTAGDDFLISFKYQGMEQALSLSEFEAKYMR
jgi:hypothetical protein